jgi:hypothetical protein
VQAAREDWLLDTAGTDHTFLDYPRFRRSLFELADLWTDSLKADKYVDFLQKLYERITRRAPVTEWKKLKNVMHFALKAEADAHKSHPEHSGPAARDGSPARPELSLEQIVEREQARAAAEQQLAIDKLLAERAEARARAAASQGSLFAPVTRGESAVDATGRPFDITIESDTLKPRRDHEDDEDLRKIELHDLQDAKVRDLLEVVVEKDAHLREAKHELDTEIKTELYFEQVMAERKRMAATGKDLHAVHREMLKRVHDQEMAQLTARLRRRTSVNARDGRGGGDEKGGRSGKPDGHRRVGSRVRGGGGGGDDDDDRRGMLPRRVGGRRGSTEGGDRKLVRSPTARRAAGGRRADAKDGDDSGKPAARKPKDPISQATYASARVWHPLPISRR